MSLWLTDQMFVMHLCLKPVGLRRPNLVKDRPSDLDPPPLAPRHGIQMLDIGLGHVLLCARYAVLPSRRGRSARESNIPPDARLMRTFDTSMAVLMTSPLLSSGSKISKELCRTPMIRHLQVVQATATLSQRRILPSSTPILFKTITSPGLYGISQGSEPWFMWT